MHPDRADRSSAPLLASAQTQRRAPPRGIAWAAVLLGALITGCAGTMAAPDAYAQSQEEVIDPPGRVGSVSALRGPVDASTEAGGAWETAQINQPVTSQTALFAQPGSQAEVRIGSTSVRLDGNTQAVFSQVDDHAVVLDVAQGSVRARVRNLPGGDRFMLVADGVRAEAQGPGDYRVSYDPNRRAYTVRTLAGRMKVVTPGNSFNLESGQEALVENGGSALQLRAMGQRDDFDLWAEARDRDQDRLAAARYVSPEMTGIESLDAHGRWDTVGDYGPVWYPTAVPYGWAPYRYGRWAYVQPWGWTWVDDAPWGFAPFHYGRWAQIGGSWGWVPGPIVARPVYAPALVGYVGGGSGNVSVNVGFGGGRPIGWFPLGPREVYQPPYRYGPRYAQQVNIINVTNVVNTPPPNYREGDRRVSRPPNPIGGPGGYRYARQPDAVTMVDEDQFRGARPIGRDRMNLTPQQTAALQPVIVAPPGRGPNGGGATTGGPGAGLPRAALPLPARDPREGVGRFVPRSESNDDRARFVPPADTRAPFDRGQPGQRRDLTPGPSTMPLPQAAVPQTPVPQAQQPQRALPPAQAQVPAGADPRFQGRRNDPRFDNDERGERRIPQQRPPQFTPEPARAAPPAQQAMPRPAPAPAPQMAPRPMPAPQAAPPQPPPQAQQPQRFRQQNNPNRDADESPRPRER